MGNLSTRRISVVGTLRLVAFLGVSLFSAGCPGSSPTTPTPPPPSTNPVVSSISPPGGSTLGGTEVTIGGANLSGTSAVTIGGVAATNMRVIGSTTVQAVTGAHAAGATDVVLTVTGQAVTLASAFTYAVPPPPTVTAISPTSGTTAGGTPVTLTGTAFGPGATVRVGGVAATSVEVVNATTMRAVTGARTSGLVDVAVTVGAQTGTMPAAFTYVAPAVNPLPVISGITVQGTRTNEPPAFADVGEELVVTAAVTDAETQPDSLVYEWSADGGVFTGTGRSVRWRAPGSLATPALLLITLKVTEVTAAAADGGAHPSATQSVSATTLVRVHDSAKEAGALAVRFLTEFSQQTQAPATIIRDFWSADVCKAGRDAELQDVTDNQANYKILSYTIGAPSSWTLAFGGSCPLNEAGDGCVAVPCEWRDMRLKDGDVATTTGVCRLSAAYRQSRWWLCSSRYEHTSGGHPFLPGAVPFIR